MNSSTRHDQESGPDRTGGLDHLAEMARALGEAIPCTGNQPLRIADPDMAWIVESGAVDVFGVEFSDGQTASAFKHMVRVPLGHLMFGYSGDHDTGLGLIAKGFPGTTVRPIPISELLNGLTDEVGQTVLVEQIDSWILKFAEAVARDIDPKPRPDHLLAPGSRIAASGTVSARHGILWLDGRDAEAAYLGLEGSGSGPSGLMPVSAGTWVSLHDSREIQGVLSKDMTVTDLLYRHLPEFHRIVLATETLNRQLMVVDDVNLQIDRAMWRNRDWKVSRDQLFSVIDLERKKPRDGPGSLAALRAVCAYGKIPLREFGESETRGLDDLLVASGLRSREVRLKRQDRWWLGDSGALIAYRKDDDHPVALLPGRFGRYRYIDPVSGKSRRITAKTAEQIGEVAFEVHRPLPGDRPAGAVDLLRLATWNQFPDLIRVVVAGIAAGAILLVPAAMIGLLAEDSAAAREPAQFMYLFGLLVLLAVAAGLLNVLRGTAMMRLEARAATRIVAAVWDRLLWLRPNFFSRFTTGDLATRAMTFLVIRDQFSAVASGALQAVLLLLPTSVLIFLYDPALGWLSLVLGVSSLGIALALGLVQVRYHRERLAAMRRLTGHLFQLVNCIGKLRAAGAEPSAYAWWARQYRKQKVAEIGISRLNEHLFAFSLSVPALWTAIVFMVVLARGPDHLAIEGFSVVYAASMLFVGSVILFGLSFEAIASLIPASEQTREIISAMPEAAGSEGATIELNGEVSFDQVSFRYSKDSPLVLDNVSIRARPGEFIALVGESGSGKSTLLRLALGLENPSSGAVYFDGHDISRLNPHALRRQMGVVLQDNRTMAATILQNITGIDDALSITDAWSAADQVGVAQDISKMPMGMHTPMTGTGSTFSGGQQQRIRIAAALVRNPKILFLDEATSWLDSRSQELTMKGIERSNATRIVVAHRISTIRRASRIFLLHKGKIAEEGTYDELMEADGLFRRLVERQSA